MTTTRTPAHVQQMLADRGARVLDVRSPGEFATGHIPEAANIPVDQVAAYLTPITATAPVEAPAETPSTKGSARALRSSACIAASRP